jgi:hypothetical protein
MGSSGINFSSGLRGSAGGFSLLFGICAGGAWLMDAGGGSVAAAGGQPVLAGGAP